MLVHRVGGRPTCTRDAVFCLVSLARIKNEVCFPSEFVMTMRLGLLCAAVLSAIVAACGEHDTAPNVAAPGAPAGAKTRLLETGTDLLQEMQPIDALNVYVNGFHFMNGNMRAQMEAHHYCSVLNEDVKQCVLFDSNGPDAKLTGVEYIISRRVFETLPRSEKALWHSHAYEVKSGQLIAPGVPEAAEHAFMEDMAGTYGKTWHTWQTDQNFALPVGHPMLMVGFTADGQANVGMIAARDKRFDVATEEKRRNRKDIHSPRIVAGADAWKQGEAMQLMLHPTTVQRTRSLNQADEVLTRRETNQEALARLYRADRGG
jgi:hypothetical protein